MSLKFYFAARYSRLDELCAYRKDMVERGHHVPARWLRGGHQIETLEAASSAPKDEARRFAIEDLEDVVAADVIVSFTEQPRTTTTRGGRHVELGIGIGLRMADRTPAAPTLVVVGPFENVFHALPHIDAVFDDWPAFLAAFDALPSEHGWSAHGVEHCGLHPWHAQPWLHRKLFATPPVEGT
jgi:hypothetical protein